MPALILTPGHQQSVSSLYSGTLLMRGTQVTNQS